MSRLRQSDDYLPLPVIRGEGRGEGSLVRRLKSALTLTLSRSTGRGDGNRSMADASSNPATLRHSIGWLMHYALRRWRPMVVVVAAMLLRIGLDLLKPWPMKVLV